MTTPNVPSEPVPVSTKKKGCAIVSTLVVLGGVVLCLGAIATPKYGGFNKCKSRQSEAKTNLSGIFTAQKALMGESSVYTTDLVALGWGPDGSPNYVYGFAKPGSFGEVAALKDHDPTRRTTLDPRVIERWRFRPEKAKRMDGSAFTDADFETLAPASSVGTGGFLAVAIGDLDADGDPNALDIWTIDQNKNLVAVRNDCAD